MVNPGVVGVFMVYDLVFMAYDLVFMVYDLVSMVYIVSDDSTESLGCHASWFKVIVWVDWSIACLCKLVWITNEVCS